MQIIVSIITPTYNRAGTLSRLHESLCNQTDLRFEWIVVDDGSTDNSRELIAMLIKNSPFQVKYFYKENGGQHTARNLGIKHATGEHIILLDSDDALVRDAVETSIIECDEVFKNENYFAVMGRYIDEHGSLVGEPFPEDMNLRPKPLKRRWFRKNKRDCVYIIRADILKRYPFPEPKDIKYTRDSILWNELHARYEAHYINQVFGIVFYDQDNRVTKVMSNWSRRYRGYLLRLDLFNRIFMIDKTFSLLEKKSALNQLMYDAYKINKTPKDVYRDLTRLSVRMLITPIYFLFICIGKIKKRETYMELD